MSPLTQEAWFGVALGINPRIFAEVFKKPKSVLLGMLCQLVLLPAFTFLLAILMGPWISPMMGLGMILVASCPGGNISNFMSSLSKANVELSVSLTAISTALAVILTPANFYIWGNLYLHTAKIATEVPTLVIPLWDVFKTIFILLGIPLTLGILSSYFLPKVAEKMKKPFQWLSILFFIAMVILSFAGNLEAFLKCVKYIFLVVLIHNLLALGIGFGTGTVFKVLAWNSDLRGVPSSLRNAGDNSLVGYMAHNLRTHDLHNIQFERQESLRPEWGRFTIRTGDIPLRGFGATMLSEACSITYAPKGKRTCPPMERSSWLQTIAIQ